MRTIKYIIIICFIVGFVLFAVGLSQGGSLSTIFEIGRNDHLYGEQLSKTFEHTTQEIYIDFENRHLIVHFVEDTEITMTYHEHEKDTWTFLNEAHITSIVQKNQPSIRFFNFGWTSRHLREVHLYLPQTITYDLNIRSKTGTISLEFDQMTLFSDLFIQATTGNIEIKNVEVPELLNIVTTTGNIKLSHVNADQMDFSVTTGRITMNDIKANELIIESTTGSVRVDDADIDGLLKITCSTGSITINDVLASDYDLKVSTGSINATFSENHMLYFDLSTTTGSIRVNGSSMGKTYQTTQTITQVIRFKARTTTGSIDITQNT